jgi:sec-independent protein translocase protein TatB
MLDIGWTEMLVIAIIMIVVVGPKDLPKMLRTFGRATTKMRSMAGDFQRQFNEAMREAELEDVKKSVDSLRSLNPTAEIRKQLNPFEKAAADVRAGIDGALKSPKTTEPPSASAAPAEPLKAGATAMPAAVSEPPPAVSSEARPVTGPTVATDSGSLQPSAQQPAGPVPAAVPPAKPAVRARKKTEGAANAKPKPPEGVAAAKAAGKRRSKPAGSAS